MKSIISIIVLSVTIIFNLTSADTLSSIKAKGFIQCGVNTGLPGFSSADKNGVWKGLDVDFCRAVAAATLGDANKVKFTPLTAKERFTALQSGEIDILSRNTTWTLTRDASLGINYVGVIYYDGQGFMVNKNIGVKNVNELSGATVCLHAGTTTELNLADYFRTNKLQYKAVTYDTADATIKGFEAGRCDVLTSDHSQLFALRLKLKKPGSAMILPDIISKEPLGPVVRQGDDKWFNIVKWSLFTLVNAEELGLSSQNVESRKSSTNPVIARLMTGQGEKLGLNNDWPYQIIKQVGNYAELYDRNVGIKSP